MLLKADEVAQRLGIGRSTVYDLIHTDPTFPAIWIHDRCVRVVEAQLDNWIAGRLAQKEVAHG